MMHKLHSFSTTVTRFLFKLKARRIHYEFLSMDSYERKQLTTQLKIFLNKKEAE